MRISTALIALALSTIGTSVAAQELDLRPADVFIDSRTGALVSAMNYAEDHGERAARDALAFSQLVCSGAGQRNRANPYNGWDLDVRGSVRGGDRNARIAASIAGDLLQGRRERREDANRQQAEFERDACRLIERTVRRND